MSAPTTYSELQAKVVDLLHRTGDATVEALAPDWIAYAEAEMQTELELLEFETTANVTITAGVGTLPTGYLAARSLYWDAATDEALEYLNPETFDALGQDSGDPSFYTVTGSSLKLSTTDSGTVVMTYNARFTPLSNSNTSNAILTNFPNAYVYGALKHASLWTKDDADVQKYGLLFNAQMDRINKSNERRKYAGALTVRAR